MNENKNYYNRKNYEWEKEYFDNKKIEIINFLNLNHISILKKLEIFIEDKKYTEYEYNIIEMILYNYYETDINDKLIKNEKLNKRGITLKEYEEILNVFTKISSYYKL